jgi:hypothetical protein
MYLSFMGRLIGLLGASPQSALSVGPWILMYDVSKLLTEYTRRKRYLLTRPYTAGTKAISGGLIELERHNLLVDLTISYQMRGGGRFNLFYETYSLQDNKILLQNEEDMV